MLKSDFFKDILNFKMIIKKRRDMRTARTLVLKRPCQGLCSSCHSASEGNRLSLGSGSACEAFAGTSDCAAIAMKKELKRFRSGWSDDCIQSEEDD
ncbi:hypothetical protein AVEN_273617-1 [Araneus ventricosus]|uniref:Uncharacterized protein n=1 Tax=Araneus ventricosus TaxID=182803 RepID=A0A4Y2JVD4_ARAVE|nr:hypothetical protein AVEN_273617-1 [Araneus ventricosus]